MGNKPRTSGRESQESQPPDASSSTYSDRAMTPPRPKTPPRPPVKMLSPANAAAAASLSALKEELAQTHLRVHFYEQRRENFEHEHPLPMAWGGTGDRGNEKDEN